MTSAPAERYIVTRTTVAKDEADIFYSLPKETLDTIEEVHYRDGDQEAGRQGAYSIDLTPDQFDSFTTASNLVDIISTSHFGLGEYTTHTASDEIESLSGLFEDDSGIITPEDPSEASGDLKERFWRHGKITDQGREGRCTGDCCLQFLTSSPVRSFPKASVNWLNTKAYALYRHFQTIDEWPGEDYVGSSVSAACKWLRAEGKIEAAGVTSSHEEMVAWLQRHGGLMLSTPWYEGQYRTDENGFARPTGRKVGGHAILCFGVSRWGTLYFANSWGEGYGKGGVGYMERKDVQFLIENGLRAYTAKQVEK